MARLVQLPAELLAAVLDHLCLEDASPTTSLLAASSACRTLRAVAIASLFRRLVFHRNFEEIVRDSRHIESLLSKAEIRENVKEVHFGSCPASSSEPRTGVREEAEVSHKVVLLLQGLPNLHTLRFRKLYDLMPRTLVMQFLSSLVAVLPSLDIYWDEPDVRQSVPFSLKSSIAGMSMILGDLGFRDDPWCLDNLRVSLRRFSRLKTLYLVIARDDWADFDGQPSQFPTEEKPTIRLPSLRELRITFNGDLQILRCLDVPEICKLKMSWLSNSRLDTESLKSFSFRSPKLKSLHMIQFDMLGLMPVVMDREILAKWTLSELFLDGFLFADHPPPTALATGGSMYQIRSVGLPTEIQVSLPPNLSRLRLRHVSLVRRENPKPDITTSEALRTLLHTSPKITHLEIDIGPLDKLWHPIAVPGVDIDVHIYSILQRLASFSHLTFLRLMAPYDLPASDNNFQNAQIACQPFSDDAQAIRIYRALRALGSSVQRLLISLSPEQPDMRFGQSLDPMAWEVRELGDKVLLVVRQRGKDYEHRQVWSGQRRLWTSMKHVGWERSIAEICG